jgi:hypothetical protein
VRRLNLPGLLGRYVLVGLACSGFVAGHVMSGASGARLGAGLAVAWTAVALRRALWQRGAPARAFELAASEEPAPEPSLPASYRTVLDAVSLACSPGGNDAVETRLRPLLRNIAVQRLSSHRGIDLLTDPSAALPLLGEDLYALVSRDYAARSERSAKAAPGIPVRVLEDWVERLDAI